MYNILKLNNNIKIVNQKLINTNAVTFAIWIKIGSRHENEKLSGISHFIEHMLFKGTKNKTAKDIAIEIDAIGGRVNAFTSKEYTCYHLTTIKPLLEKGINLFVDMFFNSKFDNNDIDLERTVINEEISMYEDSPDDLVFDSMLEKCFNENPLGKSILGNKYSLNNINNKTIKNYINENYISDNIIISLVGDYDENHLNLIKSSFEKIKNNSLKLSEKSVYKTSISIKNKQLEQNHICLGFPSISITDNKKYSINLLNNIIGGCMSSRLFQKVREEYGLCYHISSFNLSYSDIGIYSIYVALNKTMTNKAIKLILDIIRDICLSSCSLDELKRAKDQVKTNFLLSLENSDYYMKIISTHTLYNNNITNVKEIIQNYDNISIEDIRNIANQIFNLNKMSISIVGQIDNIEETYNFYQKLKQTL